MYIICFVKLVKFLESKEVIELSCMIVIFMVFMSLRGGSDRMISDLPDVCEFPKVFPDDISDLLPKHEVEFSVE